MKLWKTFAVAITLALMPLVASAQYKDLDAALGNLKRGFGSGDTQALIAGLGENDQVQLQFPGLVEQNGSGFYGRDQAAYLLDGLFSKVKPTGFEQQKARKSTAEGQYHIQASWTVAGGARDLYVTLQKKGDNWTLASVRTGSAK